MFGTLAPPNQNLSVLATGVPAYDPSQVPLPYTSTTWLSGAWNFYDTSSALLQNPTTWYGYSSNCAGCSIARMVTIAQNGGLDYDDSCYGYCQVGGADADWYENVAGQLISPCNQNLTSSPKTEECTIEYITSWVGGENDTSSGIGYSVVNDQEAAEGINLSPYGDTSASLRALGRPLSVGPSSVCTLDAKDYCAALMSTSLSPCVQTGFFGVFKGGNESIRELQETTTETETYERNPHTGSCQGLPASVSWSPNNPATFYGDSNLP